MRPRVFPAENEPGAQGYSRQLRASMRPRVFPAENRLGIAQASARATCFNEAAGIPRGKPAMRPLSCVPLGELQ